eukprot:15446245-Alexandrium_andersonii.AAC.1
MPGCAQAFLVKASPRKGDNGQVAHPGTPYQNQPFESLEAGTRKGDNGQVAHPGTPYQNQPFESNSLSKRASEKGDNGQ